MTQVRYLLVASMCLILHNLIMIAGAALAVAMPVSALLSFLLTGFVGHQFHSRFTFGNPPTMASFVRYLFAMAPNYPIAVAILWVLLGPVALPMKVAAPASTVLMTAMNFALSRWAVLGRAKARKKCAS